MPSPVVVDVFDGDGIGELVKGQQIAVAVIDIAAHTGDGAFFFDHQLERIHIFLAVYQLEIKQAPDEPEGAKTKDHA